jgi:membrane-bound lytic murein transglycosylase D
LVLFTRTIGIVLLLVATSCRTTPDNPPEPVEPAAYIDLSQPEEAVAELDVEVEETIDIGEDGLCHDGIIADYLIKKFRKENPVSKAETKVMNKRRKFAGSIDTKAIAHARDVLVGPAAPYFGAIPVVVNSEVDFWIQYFKTSGKRQFMRWLVRGESFKQVLQPILQENGLPPEFFYMAMIESGFNNGAFSSAKATGTWQFMQGTAKIYGLRIDHWVDERRDPVKSSVAAASFLRDLYRDLGDWNLAMAAYNAGPGKVRRAIKATGTRNFWDIAKTRHLAKETQQYVPKILAAILLAANPKVHGFDYQQSAAQDIPTNKILLPNPVRLDEVAKELNISLATLQSWNPEIIRNVTPPRKNGYELRLTTEMKEKFPSIEPNLSKIEITDVQLHKVKRGETLSKISRLYKVSISQILQVNPGLRATALRPGKDIAIPIPGIVSALSKKTS